MTVVAADVAVRANGRPARGHYAVAALLLASATLLAHAWSLGDGLALDDHWHYHSFRESGWGPRDLLDATGYPEPRPVAPRGINTVGGLIQLQLDRIPTVGDRTVWNSLQLEVITMDGVRIGRVRVTAVE